MENAVEALKIGFGVIVFAVALTVLFRMTSSIRATSEEIFKSIDETTYIDYTVDTSKIDTNTGKRLVNFTDIIPTIYRYSQEGYGVTIIDNDEIIARFDLDTESQVATCVWNEVAFNSIKDNQIKENINKTKHNLAKYIKNNIYDVAGILVPDNLNNESTENYSSGNVFSNFGWLNDLINKIYGKSGNVYTAWASSNRYVNNYITQRINCDLYGGQAIFNTQYPGVGDITDSKLVLGKYEAYYNNGLLEQYKDSNFIEYITEIDINTYIKDTDLFQYGQIRYAKQRELIYVKQ